MAILNNQGGYPSTRLSFRESLQCLWHLMSYTTCSPTALQPVAQCKVPATVLPNLSPSFPGARHFRRPSVKLVGVNGKDRANLEISKARSAWHLDGRGRSDAARVSPVAWGHWMNWTTNSGDYGWSRDKGGPNHLLLTVDIFRETSGGFERKNMNKHMCLVTWFSWVKFHDIQPGALGLVTSWAHSSQQIHEI